MFQQKLLVCLLAILPLRAASAALVTSLRFSEIQASGNSDSYNFYYDQSTNLFGPWTDTVGQELDNGVIKAIATQNSDIAATKGKMVGSADTKLPTGDGIAAQAWSSIILFFEVSDHAEELNLDGTLSASGGGVSHMLLTDNVTSQQLIQRDTTTASGDITFSDSLLLPIGQYRLQYESTSAATGFAGFSTRFSAGPPVASVPLPAASVSGLSGLALVLVGQWIRFLKSADRSTGA